MVNITQMILHAQELRGMGAYFERTLTEIREEARTALKKEWQRTKGSNENASSSMFAARWLNSTERAALVKCAGFSDILEAAVWLDKEVLA